MSAENFPAIGFNPAPGKVESVNDLVTKLSSALTGLDSAHRTLSTLTGGGQAWEGDAAKGFADNVGDLPKWIGKSRDAMRDASTQLQSWHGMLAEYQTKARQYEAAAGAAKGRKETFEGEHQRAVSAYNQAAGDPAFRLAGQVYTDDAALKQAQGQIDAANNRLKQAGETVDSAKKKLEDAMDEFEGIVKQAKELLGNHQSDAREIAERITRATDGAPDPGFWDKLGDAFTRLGHSIQNWCTKHADLLKKIGDWLSMAGTVMGVLALLTLWCPPLSGAFALAGGALSLGALATHGAAKLGGADVGWTDLAGDALGVLPVGKLGKSALMGVKVPLKLTRVNGRAIPMIDSANKIRALSGAGHRATDLTGRSWVGLGRQYAQGSKVFKAEGGLGNRLKLGWNSHVQDNLGASLKERGLSKIVEHGPQRLRDSFSGAIRADGTLDPMSWWSRGTQIAGQAPGIGLGAYNFATNSDTPAAGRL